VRRAVALTHGHEAGGPRCPGARSLTAPHRRPSRRGHLHRRKYFRAARWARARPSRRRADGRHGARRGRDVLPARRGAGGAVREAVGNERPAGGWPAGTGWAREKGQDTDHAWPKVRSRSRAAPADGREGPVNATQGQALAQHLDVAGDVSSPARYVGRNSGYYDAAGSVRHALRTSRPGWTWRAWVRLPGGSRPPACR